MNLVYLDKDIIYPALTHMLLPERNREYFDSTFQYSEHLPKNKIRTCMLLPQ